METLKLQNGKRVADIVLNKENTFIVLCARFEESTGEKEASIVYPVKTYQTLRGAKAYANKYLKA